MRPRAGVVTFAGRWGCLIWGSEMRGLCGRTSSALDSADETLEIDEIKLNSMIHN